MRDVVCLEALTIKWDDNGDFDTNINSIKNLINQSYVLTDNDISELYWLWIV